MIGTITLCDYQDKVEGMNCYQSYRIDFNCLHVRIIKLERGTGLEPKKPQTVFSRGRVYENGVWIYVDDPKWYDEKHKKIAEAMQALERALTEAIR